MGAGRKLIFVGLFVVAAALSWRAMTGNRERRELEFVESQLDAELRSKRPVAEDRDEWNERLALLEKELAILRIKTTPDLASLSKQLEPLGVKLVEASSLEAVHPFVLTGGSTVAAALEVLRRSGHEIDAFRVEVHEQSWTGDFVAHVYVDTSTTVLPPPMPEEAWYSFLNGHVRARIQEKQNELAALDRDLGKLTRYWDLQEEADRRENLIEELGQRRIDLVGLAMTLFVKEPKAFATGSLERSQAELRGGMIGRLARPIQDPDLAALFAPLSARIVRRYADTVEVAFSR